MQRKRKLRIVRISSYNGKVIRAKGPQLYSPKQKLFDCIWEFKIGDADDHPSVPHAHAREFGYKLNAWTGEIFPAGNEREKVIGNLTKKELSRLHNDSNFIKFAKKQIEWYQSSFPHINFDVPDWFRCKYLKVSANLTQKNTVEEYVFIGKASIQQH